MKSWIPEGATDVSVESDPNRYPIDPNLAPDRPQTDPKSTPNQGSAGCPDRPYPPRPGSYVCSLRISMHINR